MKRHLLLLLFLLAFVPHLPASTPNPPAVAALLERIGGKGASERLFTLLDPSLSEGVENAGNEVFVITTHNGKPAIQGSRISALTAGIGGYL